MAEKGGWVSDEDVAVGFQSLPNVEDLSCSPESKMKNQPTGKKQPPKFVKHTTSLMKSEYEKAHGRIDHDPSSSDDSSDDAIWSRKVKQDVPKYLKKKQKVPIGRAKFLQDYLPRDDRKLQKQLREACGPGYSNELIEYHHKIRVEQYEKEQNEKNLLMQYHSDEDDFTFSAENTPGPSTKKPELISETRDPQANQ